jgi:hypothetical protein
MSTFFPMFNLLGPAYRDGLANGEMGCMLEQNASFATSIWISQMLLTREWLALESEGNCPFVAQMILSIYSLFRKASRTILQSIFSESPVAESQDSSEDGVNFA